MITQDELQTILGVDKVQLSELIKSGLPKSGNGKRLTFDEREVANWLVNSGRATKETFADSPGELARQIGVSVRTIHNWIASDDTFRWSPPFPVEEIRDWHQQIKLPRKKDTAVTAVPPNGFGERFDKEYYEVELAKERLATRRIRNAKERGELVSVDLMSRRLARTTAVVAQILDELVGYIMSLLPAAIKGKVRARIEKGVRSRIDIVKEMIGEAFREDKEDIEEEDIEDGVEEEDND